MLCHALLAHPLTDRIRKANRLFRDIPFSVSYQEKIVEGKIDLLFEKPDGWVIVDYKTDNVSAAALEKRFQIYREQGKWYARAVEKAAGNAVKEVNFFFVRAGELRFSRILHRSLFNEPTSRPPFLNSTLNMMVS